jgi:acyl-CoA thioester hydrolase
LTDDEGICKVTQALWNQWTIRRMQVQLLDMKRSEAEPWKYVSEVEVKEDQIDVNGHVNNMVYVGWMIDAAVGHSRASGGTAAMEKCGGSWVVRSHYIEYLSPAYLMDTVRVSTWVENIGAVRSLRKYRFERTSDSALLASGETDWVYVDAGSGSPVRIPGEVRVCFSLPPQNDKQRS